MRLRSKRRTCGARYSDPLTAVFPFNPFLPQIGKLNRFIIVLRIYVQLKLIADINSIPDINIVVTVLRTVDLCLYSECHFLQAKSPPYRLFSRLNPAGIIPVGSIRPGRHKGAAVRCLTL